MKKIIANAFNKISINKKLMTITIIGAIIPIALMIVLVMNQIRTEFEENRQTAVTSISEKISFNVAKELADVENILSTYTFDSDLAGLISGSDNLDLLEQYESRMDIDIADNRLIEEVTIFTEDNIPYKSDKFRSLEEIENEAWYQVNKANFFYLNVFRSGDHVVMVKTLNSRNHYSGSIIRILLDERKFTDLLRHDLLDEFDGQVYLLDELKQVVASSSEMENQEIKAIRVEDHIVKTNKVGEDYYFEDWAVLVMVPDSVLSYDFWSKARLIILFTLVIVAVMVYMNFKVSKSIGNRLKILSDTMISLDGGQIAIIDQDMGNDEIGQTASMYNKMATSFKRVISELKSEKEKSDRLLRDKTNAYNEINSNYERIRLQSEQINNLVYSDTLTGLKNRLAITEEIETSVYLDQSVGVLFLDVDNFKFINDTYGHDLGDQVIESTAKILKSHQNNQVEIGRFGGDEFLIVLKNCHTTSLMDFAKRIQEAFIPPVVIDDKKFYLTVSIGCSIYPDQGLDHMELIKKADLALYDAKDSGRNIVKLYHEDLDSDLEERIAFQNAIKDALSDKEFYLNYQPYYNADTGKLDGFEALIRWYSNRYGQVNPYKLVTHAEAMGLIVDLGDWIFREACLFAKRINTECPTDLTVSINISMIQLLSHDFYDRVLEIVNEIDLDPKLIVLEMTETILIDSIDSGANVVQRLREAGFGIALDDFGTGYSSLSYLKRLPVSVVKIDKSFIDNISKDVFDKEFVETIIKLAHNRSLTVVAEGVEDQSQVEVLKALDCDILQGYFFNKPMGEKDIKNMCC